MILEVLKNQKNKIGFKTDVWSLGITAIEMAEGSPPHFNLDSAIVVGKITRENPPRLSNTYSFEFQDFIKNCLVKDPSHRATVLELLTHPFIRNADSSGEALLLSRLSQVSVRTLLEAQEKHNPNASEPNFSEEKLEDVRADNVKEFLSNSIETRAMEFDESDEERVGEYIEGDSEDEIMPLWRLEGGRLVEVQSIDTQDPQLSS